MDKVKRNNLKFKNGWVFALVNGRLAEIYSSSKFGIWAHSYIKRNEFSKEEQKIIDEDIKKYIFSYKKGLYYDKIRKLKYKVPEINKIFPDLKGNKKKG